MQLIAAGLARVARLLPGSRVAERQLRFSLERSVDEYAVELTGNPIALASAILKVAESQRVEPARGEAALGLLGQGRTTLRLDCLLAGGRQRASRPLERSAVALAVVLAILTLGVAIDAAAWFAAALPDGAFGIALSCAR